MVGRALRRMLRHLGIDARRYTPGWSEQARMAALFATYGVDCVFDVGANAGQYAFELRECGYQGRIVSFEPLSKAHAMLLENSRRDALWEVAPAMALGDTDGEVRMNVAGNLLSSSIREMTDTHLQAAPHSAYVGAETVRLATLDSVYPLYVGDSSRPFLKIDTQGYETQVLDGARACLGRFIGLQAEMSLTELYRGQTLFLEFAARLSTEGFELAALFPCFTDDRTGRMLQVNGVFFRG